MSKRIFTGLAVTLVAVLLTFFISAPVLAADLRSADTVAIASGEVVDDDLYVACNTIVIDGTVNGDLWAMGSAITVNGEVTGSIVAAAQTVNINGNVGHAARLAGETVNISGDVGGDLIVFSSEANIASKAKIGGDFLFGAGRIHIDGLVEGSVKGGGGAVAISNGVKGDIELEVDTLTVASTADIGGNLTYTSEDEADIHFIFTRLTVFATSADEIT